MAKTKEPPAEAGAAEDARAPTELTAAAVANWWAKLGPGGVLLGFSETPIEGAPEVPVDCDLKPGRYRWNDEAGRWDPLANARDVAATAVALEQLQPKALALLIAAIAAGRPVPRYCTEWADEWSRTVDARGADPDRGIDQDRGS